MTGRGVVSIGVAAGVGPEVVGRLAPAIEEAGFHSLWVNDVPGADALRVLDAAARTTQRLVLATGVMPLDRRPAKEIVAEVEALELPTDRLILGVGSGLTIIGGLKLVKNAVAELHDTLSAKVFVGALGPKKRRLAVDVADGVLLTWLTPENARTQAAELHAAAPGIHVTLYARTALDPAAADRLDVEAQRYATYPAYAANFTRQGAQPSETVLDGTDQSITDRLEAYRDAADEVVLRAMTRADELDDYLDFVTAAKALV